MRIKRLIITLTTLTFFWAGLVAPVQGAMLATGLTRFKVRKIPTAIVIPTGSELVQPGDPPLFRSPHPLLVDLRDRQARSREISFH